MTQWTPSLETGLNGNRYVETDLEAFADDLAQANSPGVYALKLSVPENWRTVLNLWDTHYEVNPPDWVREAFDARAVLYVGAAKNVLERLHSHIKTPNQSSAITHVYPIHSLWDVWWFDDAQRAFERESGIAIEIANTNDGLYVHQR